MRLRPLIGLAAAGLVLVGIWRAFQPTPVIVDLATLGRGPLEVTVDDDGRTRIRERYTVSAPLRGRVLRSPLEPGDPVRAGETLVAEFEPVPPGLLDARSRAEAEGRLARARAAILEVEARRAQAEADLDFAESELRRFRELVAGGIGAGDQLEAAERDARLRREALRAADFAVQVAAFEVEIAAAALREPDPPAADGEPGTPPPRRHPLRAPIDGLVLRVHEESERILEAGTPIVELGDPRSIEVVADFLTRDAVRVRPGMPAAIVGWGGLTEDGREPALAARVRLVEPSGFTKISALGVEEQRVDIVLDPERDPAAWTALGDGYRVEVRIRIWSGEDLLRIPTGALFRHGEAWAAFAVDAAGRARLTPLRIGRRSGLEAEVLEGLEAGARVVLYPSALVTDGTPLEAR
jgi:HlyD family secretion protein